jgi:hypothetical protein
MFPKLLIPRKNQMQQFAQDAARFDQVLLSRLRAAGVEKDLAYKLAQAFNLFSVPDTQALAQLAKDDITNWLAIQDWANSIPEFITWHWPTYIGQLTNQLSDARSTKYPGLLRVISIDVTTFNNTFVISIFKNGADVLDCTLIRAGVGQLFKLVKPIPIAAYTDNLTMQANTPGTGNTGITVTAEIW